MDEWIRTLLDLVLIGLVGAGLVQATRLIKHLSGLQEGRVDMEKFVREFSATVYRAEAGIKGLKQAARDIGDDLEKLVDKAVLVRDELHFLVESADQIAERLSSTASHAVKPGERAAGLKSETRPAAKANPAPQTAAPPSPPQPGFQPGPASTSVTPPVAAPAVTPQPQPSSRAEKELLQALQKLS